MRIWHVTPRGWAFGYGGPSGPEVEMDNEPWPVRQMHDSWFTRLLGGGVLGENIEGTIFFGADKTEWGVVPAYSSCSGGPTFPLLGGTWWNICF